jgi:hypothetical protein
VNPTVIDVIRTVAQVATESNIAVATVFALMKVVRDNWPRQEGEEVPSDHDLIALMRELFGGNSAENALIIAEIEAGLPAEG